MRKIKIKTGANISSILQSTVNIPQAFTELVKNSIQNLATQVKINIEKDKITVEDNGRGFNDTEDERGKNDFDKYFVFGNSYDTTQGKGIRLGHMGIGGKLANDKLSLDGAPDWTIECKNENGKAFVINYSPLDTEFLDDYSPEVREISMDKCGVSEVTGTKITINTLHDNFNEQNLLGPITNELRTFFGFLVSKLASENKKFKIFINGQSLDFDYKLPGGALGKHVSFFEYIHEGEKKKSKVEFNLSMVHDLGLLQGSPVKGVEIISEVKICDFNLEDNDIIEKIYNKISTENEIDLEVEGATLQLFRKMIGFIICEDLSTVLDGTGMPAKDLSHHALRDDHPIVQPFKEHVYEIIINFLRAYLQLGSEERETRLNDMILNISELIEVNVEDCPELLVFGEEEVETPPAIAAPFLNKARQALRTAAFDPNDTGITKPVEWWQKNSPPKKTDDSTTIPSASKGKLNYHLTDFGSEASKEISKLYECGTGVIQILINSTNEKFQKLEQEANPLLLSMHLSECLVKEVNILKNNLISKEELDEKISEFYLNHFDDLKLKIGI